MSKLAAMTNLDLLGRSEKRHRIADKLLAAGNSKTVSSDRGGRMRSLGMKTMKKSLDDMDRTGILGGRSKPVKQMPLPKDHLQAKVAFIGGLMTAAKTVGQNLPGALRVAGVGRRMAIGAGAGAIGGAVTGGEGKRLSGAMGGAAVGAAGGALSHAGFRSAVMGKGLTPSPAGTALMRGATKSFDVPKSAVKVSSLKRADLSYDNATMHASKSLGSAGASGILGSFAKQLWSIKSPTTRIGAVGIGAVAGLSGVNAVGHAAEAVRSGREGRVFPHGAENKNRAALHGAVNAGLDVGLGALVHGSHPRSSKLLMAGGLTRAAGTMGQLFRKIPSKGDRPASSIKDDGDSPIQPRNAKDVADQ